MSPFRFLPNLLTITRMMLAVPLAYCLWSAEIWFALGVLVVAGITDLMDGFLAREFGWRTAVGAWLDPAADKIIITTSLITLTVRGDIPLWFCLLTVGRDLGLILGTTSLVFRGVQVKIQPYLSGKLAVGAQNLAILVAIIYLLWPPIGSVFPYALWLAAALTVYSAVSYGKGLAQILRDQRRTTGSPT